MTKPTLSFAAAAANSAPDMLGFREDVPLLRHRGTVTPAGNARAATATALRVGIISNARSHRNKRAAAEGRAGPLAGVEGDMQLRRPRKLAELAAAVADFARDGVDLIIIDGGDGTVRDVVTCAGAAYGDTLPKFAVVPAGKTNALALDLGVPADWTVGDAVAAARARRFAMRPTIEVTRDGSAAPDLRGFLLGIGGFVRATALAQRAHKAGAFNGFAVGLSLAWAVAQTVFGGARNPWRIGERLRLSVDGAQAVEQRLYTLLLTTLQRLPLGLKPFGAERPGMKSFTVDAPPKRIVGSLRMILAGKDDARLARRGYHRGDAREMAVEINEASGFILDGELYRGGRLTIRRGEPLAFAVP